MSDGLKLAFQAFEPVDKGVLILLVDDQRRLGPQSRSILGEAGDLIDRAIAAEDFKGKLGACLEIAVPHGLKVTRVLLLGTGKGSDLKNKDYLRLGGILAGKLAAWMRDAAVVCEIPETEFGAEHAADLALGTGLRAYRFDRYKTKKKDDDRGVKARVILMVADPAAARKAWKRREAALEGVNIARDLVNEPPNVLNPVEFAKRAQALRKAGVDIEVLDQKALRKIGMGALLAVAQGSRNDPRVVIMRWSGGKRDAAPLAFIGKGVTFDTGGISIKPAASMEDMKGDMAGAACVTGLMHTLATRKAKVNAVGVIGLVENMPDGNAQRPGDIIKSLSGQTIEVINTDAEGRLVLGDILWYVKDRFKPQFMIDLATLTGAIIVALGQEHAGMFTNDDNLAERLSQAGEATGERVWRMPLGPEYDKLIDSKFADMKNTGGRHGGSITAAQFLQRFVENMPWIHLDIAGTGFGSPQTDTNKSWGSGWGVRLLDALVAEHYER
ncbi:MAG: leucyl aminopeptidase [Variibacter sp.]|jgi:leucyl aminopeptidase|nr:leucyl aminopeptidase [Variibacter sp.]